MVASVGSRREAPGTGGRVVINAQLVSSEHTYRGAGIAAYSREVLLRLHASAPDLSFAVHASDPALSLPGIALRTSRLPARNPLSRIVWEQTALPASLWRRKPSLFHSMAFALPWTCPCPSVVTVYDLSFVKHPEAFRSMNRLYLTAMTRRTARTADAVIAISESTKQDLVREFGARPEKVRVVYGGVGERFRPLPPEQVERFRAERGLPDRIVLFIGTLEPRKNLVTLLEAYARARARGLPHKLVLAGARGWMYEPVFEAVERLGLRDSVLFPGFVKAEELVLWYNVADLFVYPSLYEGFGLPPLEAMACGVPVIVSDRASLPEVVGDAGVQVSATDPEALAAEMARILTDADLARDLSARGGAQAQAFTWERTAASTVRVYRELLARGD